MRFQHKQAFLSNPYVEIYLSRYKRPRKFGLGKGVAELVLCGGTRGPFWQAQGVVTPCP